MQKGLVDILNYANIKKLVQSLYILISKILYNNKKEQNLNNKKQKWLCKDTKSKSRCLKNWRKVKFWGVLVLFCFWRTTLLLFLLKKCIIDLFDNFTRLFCTKSLNRHFKFVSRLHNYHLEYSPCPHIFKWVLCTENWS